MCDIPSPEYVFNTLAHLGFPQHILKAIIVSAYHAAGINPWNEVPEDPFATSYQTSSCETVTSSSDASPSNSMHHQHKPIHACNRYLEPQWTPNNPASSSAEEQNTSMESPNGFSLFGGSYPSAFL